MTAAAWVIIVLLTCAVLVQWLCCLGLLVMRNAFDRLHYLGPAATLGQSLIVAAVLVRHSSTQACIKAILLCIFLVCINSILTHATARAARIRQTGRLEPQKDEEEARP